MYPEAAIPMVASALNLSRAEVHGVFTFYHGLPARKPAGRHGAEICCCAEACQAAGGDRLAARRGRPSSASRLGDHHGR